MKEVYLMEKEQEKKDNRSGIPMTEESKKEWQQAFVDIEESIAIVMKIGKDN